MTLARHWYWHLPDLGRMPAPQDRAVPERLAEPVRSSLVLYNMSLPEHRDAQLLHNICARIAKKIETPVWMESPDTSLLFLFELYRFGRCGLTDSKEQVEYCSGVSIIWIHTLGFCVCVLYVCIYGFPALGVRTGMDAWLLKSQRVTTITKCTHAWVLTHYRDRCPDQCCTAYSSAGVHLGKTVHLYTGDTPVTSLVHQCLMINYNAMYLTSSSTSMLQLSVFTRFLFIRSRIRPGVAMITCTETQCALYQDVRFKVTITGGRVDALCMLPGLGDGTWRTVQPLQTTL